MKRKAIELAMEMRREKVADMYLRKRYPTWKIALELGLSKSTIQKDIRYVKKQYQEKQLDRVQSYLNQMDIQLSAVEQNAWDAWERSIGNHRRTMKKTVMDADGEVVGEEEVVTEEQLVGDPRFLTLILSAQDRRIRIFGLDKPKEVIISTMEKKLTNGILEGRITYDMLVREVGREQAVMYFNMAGATVPDIIEGEYHEDDDAEGFVVLEEAIEPITTEDD